MPTSDAICDIVIADTGGFFAPNVIKRQLIETARDFCRFSMALNKDVAAVVDATSIDASKNYAASVVIPIVADCEAFGIFGLTMNGRKVACVERGANSPLGASILSHTGGVFFDLSNPTTCLIHPVPSGGDIRFFAAFMPSMAAASINDELWDSYGAGIIAGTKANLLMMPGYQTFNANAATLFANVYAASKKKARSDVSKKIIGEKCL